VRSRLCRPDLISHPAQRDMLPPVFLILWRQLRRFNSDRQLNKLTGERERHLIIAIINWRAGLRADDRSVVRLMNAFSKQCDPSCADEYALPRLLDLHTTIAGATVRVHGPLVIPLIRRKFLNDFNGHNRLRCDFAMPRRGLRRVSAMRALLVAQLSCDNLPTLS
jgi:hypothetical protein